MILAPIQNNGVDFQHKLKTLLQQGYHRLKHKNDILRIQDIIKNKVDLNDECLLLIDRLSVNNDSDFNERLADSVQTAFHESNGECIIEIIDSGKIKSFNNQFTADGIKFEEPSTHLFTFNNSYGACETCEGYGDIIGIDEELIIPNTGLSIYEETIACWKGETLSKYKNSSFLTQKNGEYLFTNPTINLQMIRRDLYGMEIKILLVLNNFSPN